MFGKKAPLGAQADEDYELHATPAALASEQQRGDAEVMRRGDFGEKEGRPIPQEGYVDPRAPYEPAMDVGNIGEEKDNIISVHGYMHKQGEHAIKGPLHKSWKRRYFGTISIHPIELNAVKKLTRLV